MSKKLESYSKKFIQNHLYGHANYFTDNSD